MKIKIVHLEIACACLLGLQLHASTLYVDVNGTNPTPPFADWSTAATNIQDAVNISSVGDVVLVTNGIYATGGRRWLDTTTNRVILTNSITLQSVNGPGVTWIVGNRVVGTGSILTNGVRCVGMGNSAVLSGFTITNGEAGTGNYPSGGGVDYLAGAGSGLVTNCILINNLATNSSGGGACRVTLINCQLIGNCAAGGGGAASCNLVNCLVSNNLATGTATFTGGGGVYAGSAPTGGGATGALSNCIVVGNISAGYGGGVNGGASIACVFSNNVAPNGGGAYGATLKNCLVIANLATNGGGVYGGIISNCTVAVNTAIANGGGINGGGSAVGYNSIIYDNTAPSNPNNTGAKFNNSCTIPILAGEGITNDPAFTNLAGGDFHLSASSPCINSGKNAFVSTATDLDGNLRISGGTVDIGCYEYQSPASIISYAWLQQYGLPTDGSADNADSDGTGMKNWQKWIAGLNPTNPASVLAVQSPPAVSNTNGIKVSWQGVSSIVYYVQRSTDLSQSFTTIRSNVFGVVGAPTSITDTTATNAGPYYYRVGVQ